MFKIVIIDLDGTLLNSKSEISNYTKKVIRRFHNKVKFVLASARSFTTIKPYLKELDLLDKNSYTIAFNGSLLVNNLGSPLFDAKLDLNEKQNLCQYVNNNNLFKWHYYTYDRHIVTNSIEENKKFIISNKIYKIVYKDDINAISNVRSAIPKSIVELFQITSSTPTKIEFVKKGNSKLQALKILLKNLSITPNEVIAIGDAENDTEMIKFAGCGVAMGNATNEIKLIADIVTDTNDNDGVGKILAELLK